MTTGPWLEKRSEQEPDQEMPEPCYCSRKIELCPLHTAAREMLEALELIAQTTHHVYLSPGALHPTNCPPCIATGAIAKANGEQ
jgi:hypothetical protein